MSQIHANPHETLRQDQQLQEQAIAEGIVWLNGQTASPEGQAHMLAFYEVINHVHIEAIRTSFTDNDLRILCSLAQIGLGEIFRACTEQA